MSAAAARSSAPAPTARATPRPRPPARPGNGAARRPADTPRTPPLTVVPRPAGAVARGPFIAVVLVLLAAGLLGLLLLNTVLAQGSFHLHALQVSTKRLGDQEQGLQREVDALQAPAALAAEAQRQGMVPAPPPVFLRLPDGTVLGQPTPAPTPVATLPPAVDVPSGDGATSPATTPTPRTSPTAAKTATKATPKASTPAPPGTGR